MLPVGLVALSGSLLFPASPEPLRDPRVISAHPFSGQAGAPFTVAVRGESIRDATAVFARGSGVRMTVERAEIEPPNDTSSRTKRQFDLVYLRVEAPEGIHSFRLVTPRGLSNALSLHATNLPVYQEPEGEHETPSEAIALPASDCVYTGRIARRGESDLFAIETKAGEAVTFETISGLPAPGAPGGNASGFDPSLSIYETSGSWFDPRRMNRLAFNDEPLWAIGQPTDAKLAFRFPKAGRYFLRLEAFSGQGGPDYGYSLRVRRGEAGETSEKRSRSSDERSFLRRLDADRLNQLAERGAREKNHPAVETYAANSAVKLPATIEGTVEEPGAAHRSTFPVDGPRDIAIEVETPETGPPLFNPIVRLLNSSGEEVLTNIFVGKGACTGAMTKAIQAKAIVPLRDPGEYTLEVRDTTADLGQAGFRYRVMIRPQVPHVGQVKIEEDRVNLKAGEAKTVRVVFDREEDYRGAIAVTADGLPPGVQAWTGADFEPDKDPPPYTSKRERYQPRTERTVVVFAAAEDAAVTPSPYVAKLEVRPVADGKPGAVIATKEIPMMVVAKP